MDLSRRRRRHEILPRVPPPRTPQGRHPTFDPPAVESFLLAYGDTARPPLRATVLTLDEIITDYIIETCHEAAAVASHARRQKIKLDDFKFMLRRDTAKLGRVSELLETDKELKKKRKAFDTEEGVVVRSVEGEDGEGGGGTGKGRGRKKREGDEEEDGEGRKKKKRREKGREDTATVGSG